MKRIYVALLLLCLSFTTPLRADQSDVLSDRNGDGAVGLLAFGDSITFGRGDGIPPGADIESLPESATGGGYPQRLSTMLGVPVTNSGVPGEEIGVNGADRFPSATVASTADVVMIMEGTNDAVHLRSSGDVSRAFQRVINVAVAQGKLPVLLTPPLPCCRQDALAPYVSSYDAAIRDLAAINEIPIADVARAWKTSCTNPTACELYNVPEGLHPNTVGYDVLAQTVAATLVGVDIFSDGGAHQLESALGLPADSVIVKPDLAD